MGTQLTYFDFAENDKNYLLASYKAGIKGNAIGSMSQNICERYLKHIIDEYYLPVNEKGNSEKKHLLQTHNLIVLCDFLKNEMHLEIPKDFRSLMKSINGYYFSTRYPGSDAMMLQDEDMSESIEAVEKCSDVINQLINAFEKQKTEELNEEDSLEEDYEY